MESGGVLTIYQPSQNESNLLCPSLFQRDFKSDSPNSNRQYDMRSLYKSSRRHNVSKLINKHGGAVEFMLVTKYKPTSRTHTREAECNSQSCLTLEERQERLDALPENIFTDKQDMGFISDRPVCEQIERSTSEILLLNSGSVRGSNRCLSSELESNATMGQPILVLDPSHSSKSNMEKSLYNASSSVLEIGSMVSVTDQSSYSPTYNAHQRRVTFTNSPLSTVSSEESQMENTHIQLI